MSHLDVRQRQALAQLQDLTNGSDDDVAISVLDSVGWDVQKAAELIFGATSSSTAHSSPAIPLTIETLDIDDSHQDVPHTRTTNGIHVLSFIARPFISFFVFPFHVISNIFRLVFGILRIPITQRRFSALNFYRPLPHRSRPTSRGGPDRWVRELEEETGAVCIGRAKTPRGASSATVLNGAGPSSLTARPRLSDDNRKFLPDFVLGSYEEVLRTCQREAKIGCIILVSEEHDDVTEFKRSTLTDSNFVKMLYDNDIIVWGGDVRDQEAWSAAEKLQATTYPFIAFLALQPRRQPTSLSYRSTSASHPTLTILSRHQGPCTTSIPGSPPTAAQTLIDHLANQLLPRVTPFLERIRASNRERERDRQLREEQDRAFKDSAQRDKERIESRMAEERKEKEKIRLKKEEEERRALEQKEKEKKNAVRMQWRRWARKTESTRSDEGNVEVKGLRIAIRMPNGMRVVRMFKETATLTTLYAFVDTLFIPQELILTDDPLNPPEDGYWAENLEQCIESRIAVEASSAEWWGFWLVLAFPRKEVPWRKEVRLGDVESLRGGGQIVVEMRNDMVDKYDGEIRDGGEDEDDGYDTEDSE